MAKRKGRMPTIWEVDDELWRLIKPIIDADMGKARFGGITWARTRRIEAKTG